MSVPTPIQRLTARLEQTSRDSVEGVHLTPDEVQTALSVLRSRMVQATNHSEGPLFKIETVSEDGVATDLAVVSDPVIARAAYEAAVRGAGGKLILRQDGEEICASSLLPLPSGP